MENKVFNICDGQIINGHCNKCYQPAFSTNNYCGRMIELRPIASSSTQPIQEPVRVEEVRSAEEVWNAINDSRVIKWEGLSDGGKVTRCIEAMEIYASQWRK